MKTLTRLIAVLMLVALPLSILPIGALSVSAWTTPKASELKTDEVREVRWEGELDLDVLKQVRNDIKYATAKDSKIKVLKVRLLSHGGSAIASLAIAYMVRKASDAGLVVEIHAEAVCASGCTFVLASGTPGRRYITKSTLFLVHPLQANGSCISYVEKPTTQEEKIYNTLLLLGRDAYAKYTKRPAAEVEDWLSCGQERAGGGELAVRLGMADAVED